MPSPLYYIIFGIVGSFIGHLMLKNDKITYPLGIGIGLAIGFTIANQAPAYLLAILLFAPLLIWRRNHVLAQSTSAS